ncbi:nLPC/P60 domain-containing protein [Roseburia sp. CAG:100]|jgi:cell wall-associated hydrolases (invasion-associated proteins)|nr:nLPC/P60 domain-containing protein [Roseburia sp. CAG:100]
MNKHGIRIAACALAGTFALSGYYTSLQAKINQSSTLPAAGIAVVLEEGTTIQELTQEVIQNIAYLESASGIQPNIIIASEKVAMAETPMQEETTVDSDVVQALVDSVSGDNTDNDGTKSITDSLSAGFSATDTYEDTEAATEESGEESSGESQTETVEEETTEAATEEETTEEASEEETTEAATEEEQDFRGLVIAQVNNYVNVRSIPSEDGEIVGKLYDKSVGEFEEEVNGWYKITSGNCTGYVKAEYCVTGDEAQALAKQVGTTYAVVNTTTLKVRQEASTESAVLGLVPIEEELVVVEELDGWVKVAIEEGDGYVSREYVNLRTDFVHAESKAEEEARLAEEAKEREEARAAAAATEATRAAQAAEQTVQKQAQTEAVIEAAQATAASSAGSEMGKSVIDYATQFVGNPYVYGGTSLTNGTDCSGFVMSVYANFGVSLPHSSSALRSKGYDVGGLANAQPGDIVCYSGHVALYIGNGQIVHASTSKTGIIISNANYRSILAVRRIF